MSAGELNLPHVMALTSFLRPAASLTSPTEHDVARSSALTLKYLFTLVPIVAGADKFTHFLTQWDAYLNPVVLRFAPLSAATFMQVAGVIEIVAGVLVFLRPRLGGFVVMGWLLAIALQLLVWGRFLDVAVRDIVIALSGPLMLARLAPFTLAADRGRDPRA